MSNSPIIPREKLSAYQRWELNSFNDGEAPAAGSPGSAQPHQPTDQSADAPAPAVDPLAYERGYADGLREGALKASLEAAQLKTLLASVIKQGEEINEQLADDLIKLSLEIAQRMVQHALQLHPELIVSVVQDALSRLARPLTQPVLILHPQDAAVVREQMAEQLATDNWKIFEDPELERGGCRLQTFASQADADVASRWEHITAALDSDLPWVK